MTKLPEHGRINCTECFECSNVLFNRTIRTEENWRITSNPLAWGNQTPEIIVLGFSKGPTQTDKLDKVAHESIPFKGGRLSLAKILRHINLLESNDSDSLKHELNNAIASKSGKFHFGSIIRCGVEQYDKNTTTWKAAGSNMLGFVRTPFGREIVSNCTRKYLSNLPPSVKLVVMLGYGSKMSYLESAFSAYQAARPGTWTRLNKVAYTDGKITVVHVEHFKSQGSYIPDWLGENQSPRAELGIIARETVSKALAK